MLKSLNFTQSAAANTWVINHNFGVPVIIDVNIGSLPGPLSKVYPHTMVQSNGYNTMTLTFSTPQTGTARIVADVPFDSNTNILSNPSWVPEDKNN